MKSKIIGIAVGVVLLMLVIPVCGSPAPTNGDVEFRIFAGKFYRNIGFGVTYEVLNTGDEPIEVLFTFHTINLIPRPFAQGNLYLEVQPRQRVRETFYMPYFSAGVVFADIMEMSNTSNSMFRRGFYVRELVFLNPVGV